MLQAKRTGLTNRPCRLSPSLSMGYEDLVYPDFKFQHLNIEVITENGRVFSLIWWRLQGWCFHCSMNALSHPI